MIGIIGSSFSSRSISGTVISVCSVCEGFSVLFEVCFSVFLVSVFSVLLASAEVSALFQPELPEFPLMPVFSEPPPAFAVPPLLVSVLFW